MSFSLRVDRFAVVLSIVLKRGIWLDNLSMQKSSRVSETAHCLNGGGEVGELLRSFDWSDTGFGVPEDWTQAFQISVSLCLNSRFPLILWWGPDLLMLYNDSYTGHLQSKHPSALGRPGREVWSEIWTVIGPMLHGVFTTGEATYSDDLHLLLNRNGFPEETYHTFSYSAIKDVAGNIVGIFTPVAETTEKVVAERRLRTLKDLSSSSRAETEEALMKSLATALSTNNIDLPFWSLYRLCDGQFETVCSSKSGVLPISGEVNKSAFGQALANSGTLRYLSLSSEELSEALAPLPAGIWGGIPTYAVFAPLSVHKDGEALILFSALSPHRSWDESYQSFLDSLTREVSTAITEVRALADERLRSEKLAELDRVKTAFFNNVSHEFRTPLSLMLGPLQTILDTDVSLDAARKEVEVAHRNGLRLLKLVNTLLDFSRIEAGRIEAIYEPTDLAALTTELASAFRSAIEDAGLDFIVECRVSEEPVYVDRDMWEKIVLNLLSNAFKFCLKGYIRVSLSENANEIVLEVTDTGCGIAEHELPLIFDRFHRVYSVEARTHEGTGIGLSLVDELVKFHGGKITAKSRVGEGSTFTVSIPRGKEHLSLEQLSGTRKMQSSLIGSAAFIEEAARWRTPTGPAADGFIDSLDSSLSSIDGMVAEFPETVLVADDNADMRDYLVRLLQPHWRVIAVSDGNKAWEALLTEEPDLVLTDVMMPGMDGFQLLNKIRKTDATRTTPVIMLSARAGEESVIDGLSAGADDYLPKPFSAKELVAYVRANLKLAKSRNELAEQLENVVRERTDEATRANDELRAMANLVSEHVQEPANIIASYLKLLAVRYKDRLGKDADEFIDKCLQASRSVTRMVDDLWHFSHVDKPHIAYSQVNVSEILSRVLRELSEDIKVKKVKILMQESFPEVHANAYQLEYLLKNLIDNAISFSRPAGAGEIQITCKDNGTEWLFCVEDNGIGIDAMHSEDVFQPFVRLGARPDADGTGMGLALSRKIVLSHKGWIWVESELNKGAKFFFTLPK